MKKEATKEVQNELNEEQRAYLSSFKEAMAAIDRKISERGKDKRLLRPVPKAYAQLVREGYWSPDIIAFEYALCTRKLCNLPSRLREYIIEVGNLARQIYDKGQEIQNKAENENHD